MVWHVWSCVPFSKHRGFVCCCIFKAHFNEKVHSFKATWSDAKSYCCARGMNLITVQNQNKQNCLYDLGDFLCVCLSSSILWRNKRTREKHRRKRTVDGGKGRARVSRKVQMVLNQAAWFFQEKTALEKWRTRSKQFVRVFRYKAGWRNCVRIAKTGRIWLPTQKVLRLWGDY